MVFGPGATIRGMAFASNLLNESPSAEAQRFHSAMPSCSHWVARVNLNSDRAPTPAGRVYEFCWLTGLGPAHKMGPVDATEIDTSGSRVVEV